MKFALGSKAEGVVGLPLGSGRFYGLRAATPSLVALTGSFRTSPAADRGELLLQRLVAAVASCGSTKHDQFEIADLLEGRGASLSIDSELHRVSFAARACSADMPLVIELIAESLREPRFDADIVRTEQTRLIAELQYYAAEPAFQALDALSRRLYPPEHPRHQADVADQIEQLQAFTVEDLRRFHREHFGADELCVVAVGDLDPLEMAAQVDRQLGAWSPRALRSSPDDSGALAEQATVVELSAPGRENFEVVLGQRLAIRCDHPDYLALWMANHVLGGSFSSRLVNAVREERGLTYSIHSSLAKPHREFDGHWQIGLSLSPDKLDAGLAATRVEVERLFEAGVGPEELAARQLEAIGMFQMGLATLSGLSETILYGAERGWDADYICRFADSIRALDAAQLKRVVRAHLRPEQLQAIIAGPFADAEQAVADQRPGGRENPRHCPSQPRCRS